MTDKQFNIKLIKWNPIALWTFKIDNEDSNCTICNQKITLKCIECTMSTKNVNSCAISKGKCGHGFHQHCIKKWLNNGPNKCPNCQVPWNYLYENIDSSAHPLFKLSKIM